MQEDQALAVKAVEVHPHLHQCLHRTSHLASCHHVPQMYFKVHREKFSNHKRIQLPFKISFSCHLILITDRWSSMYVSRQTEQLELCNQFVYKSNTRLRTNIHQKLRMHLSLSDKTNCVIEAQYFFLVILSPFCIIFSQCWTSCIL